MNYRQVSSPYIAVHGSLLVLVRMREKARHIGMRYKDFDQIHALVLAAPCDCPDEAMRCVVFDVFCGAL